jgi:hypothetical protein
MKDSWVKKGSVISVILLFVGVAVAPTINYSIVKASTDNGLIELITSNGRLEQPYNISQPFISIYNITGGYGVHATLEDEAWNVTNVEWNITITGGQFHFIHKNTHGTIPIMMVGKEVVIYSGIAFGWGYVKIRVTATLQSGLSYSEEREGMQQFFYTDI